MTTATQERGKAAVTKIRVTLIRPQSGPANTTTNIWGLDLRLGAGPVEFDLGEKAALYGDAWESSLWAMRFSDDVLIEQSEGEGGWLPLSQHAIDRERMIDDLATAVCAKMREATPQ